MMPMVKQLQIWNRFDGPLDSLVVTKVVTLTSYNGIVADVEEVWRGAEGALRAKKEGANQSVSPSGIWCGQEDSNLH
jgi:hypothetical protein